MILLQDFGKQGVEYGSLNENFPHRLIRIRTCGLVVGVTLGEEESVSLRDEDDSNDQVRPSVSLSLFLMPADSDVIL